MKKLLLISASLLLMNHLFAQQITVSTTFSRGSYEKFQNNFGYELGYNELLNPRSKFGLTFFQSFNEPKYTYTGFSIIDGVDYFRDVNSNNQRIGISINYGFNILNKTNSSFFVGPKMSLNYIKVDESGTERPVNETEISNFSNSYWDNNKIGIGLFLEYDKKMFSDNISLFIAAEPELLFYTRIGLMGSNKPYIIGFINFKLGIKFNLKKKMESE